MNKSNILYEKLTPKHFKQVIKLANEVHGEGYLDEQRLINWAARSIPGQQIKTEANYKEANTCSYVALLENEATDKPECQTKVQQLIGFRITYTPDNWQSDQWCSPQLWQVDKSKCCYFKCNTVDENFRGLGIGKKLLQLSIEAAKAQGALAGIAHLWKQSPNNSAVAYFTHCGGKLIKSHPNKWNDESKNGYVCILCGHDCHCEAAEMILRFG